MLDVGTLALRATQTAEHIHARHPRSARVATERTLAGSVLPHSHVAWTLPTLPIVTLHFLLRHALCSSLLHKLPLH